MKNSIAATLMAAVVALSCQPSFARNLLKDGATAQNAHHGGTGGTVSLGSYLAACESLTAGIAQAGPRNINFNGHNIQVVHLEAQGQTFAQSFLSNTIENPIVLLAPINFTLAKGNGNWLGVIVNYTPPGSSTIVGAAFVTPNSKIADSNTQFLISNGNGKYTIPVGSHGIPQGSSLSLLFFEESGNENNCNRHTSDIYELQINRSFIPIEQAPQSVCGTSCGGEVGASTTAE